MQKVNDLQFLEYIISDTLYPNKIKNNKNLDDFCKQNSDHFEELLRGADKILDQDSLTKLYLVALYLEKPITLKAKTYPIFIKAYQEYLIKFGSRLTDYQAVRSLFLYGIDQFSPYAENHSFDEYQKLKKIYNRIESYQSIGGHVSKLDFFRDSQEYAEYAMKALEHMTEYKSYYQNSITIDLRILGFALLILFNPKYQSNFLKKYFENHYSVFGDSNRTFFFYFEQMINQYGHDIFNSNAYLYVDQIIKSQNIIRRETESSLLKKSLNLDLPFKDLHISIDIPLKKGGYTDYSSYGNLYLDTQAKITLTITSDTEFAWKVRIQAERKKYFERSYEECHTNSLNVPILSEYGLLQFPEWLKIINQIYVVDWETIKISGLKKKVEKQKIMQWLQS